MPARDIIRDIGVIPYPSLWMQEECCATLGDERG